MDNYDAAFNDYFENLPGWALAEMDMDEIVADFDALWSE